MVGVILFLNRTLNNRRAGGKKKKRQSNKQNWQKIFEIAGFGMLEEPAFQCRLLSSKILLFSSVLTDILANNGFYKVGSVAFTG